MRRDAELSLKTKRLLENRDTIRYGRGLFIPLSRQLTGAVAFESGIA